VNAWERQTNSDGNPEPMLWYARFEQYRLMGPGRSLLGAYNTWRKQAGKDGNRTSTPKSWDINAERWQWKTRAEAWDAEMLARQAAEEEDKWVKRRTEWRETEFANAKALAEKAALMLRAFTVARTVTEDNGRTIVIEPGDWKPADIARFNDTASKLARLAAEMDTERQRQDVNIDFDVEDWKRKREERRKQVEDIDGGQDGTTDGESGVCRRVPGPTGGDAD
jgi:hypothetical protein